MVEISKDAFEGMKRHAEKGYPDEVCGVMTGNWEKRRLITEFSECENLNTERAHDRYELDYKKADDAARAKGLDIIGIYHSHPDHPARPSETDRLIAQPNLGYLILSIEKGGFKNATLWYLNEETEQFEQTEFSVCE